MLLLAHAGDWIEALILGLPIVLFGGWLAVNELRERRRGGSRGA